MNISNQRLKVSDDPRFAIVSGTSCVFFAEKVGQILGKPLIKINDKDFGDGEPDIDVLESVRGKTIFFFQTSLTGTGKFEIGVMRTCVIADALLRAGAGKIILCQLRYPGARQERREADPRTGKPKRRPITARVVADMYQNAGIKEVVTIHLHAPQIEGFFDSKKCIIHNISSSNVFLDYLRAEHIINSKKNAMFLSPDVGGAAAVSLLSNVLDFPPYAIFDKRRSKPGQSQIMNIIGTVKGMKVILWDDMVDSGGTAVQACDKAISEGAEEVILVTTHPILSGGACDKLLESKFSKIIFSDTMPIPEILLKDTRVTQLTLAPLIADILANLYNDESLEDLVRINTQQVMGEIATNS